LKNDKRERDLKNEYEYWKMKNERRKRGKEN
jgi:hypothetical protein